MDAQHPDAQAALVATAPDGAAVAAAIPRRYNFAADVLARNLAAGRGGKAAYIDPRGTWTYGDLAERVARFGNVLRALGIAREQRILICLTDTIDWPTAFLGAVKAGVVAVPVNTLMTEADYRFMLEDSRARLLVVSEELYPRFASLIGTCPDLAACDRLRRGLPWPRVVRGRSAGRRRSRRHRADPSRRHLLLALHLGLHRPARRARSMCRRRCASPTISTARRCSG